MTNNPNLSNPQRLDRSQAVTCDQDHGYTSEQRAFDHGLMDQFVQDTGSAKTVAQCTGKNSGTSPNYAVMDYYDGNTVTGLWNYAQHFAMSDNSYSTTFGPSSPGAINVTAGNTFGATCGGDSGAVYPATVPPCPASDKAATPTPGNPQPQGAGTMYSDADPAFDVCSAGATIGMGGQNIGDLPAVSYLKAARYQDGHAGYSDPLDEQHFLAQTINRLERLPTWKSTAVVIAYDDSDGWSDHQMGPITTQSQTPLDTLTGTGCGTNPTKVPSGQQARCGVGPRQPLLVISPYAKTNYVDNTFTDQSSVVRFIEDNWLGGNRIGNGSTDAMAGTLNNMFNWTAPSDSPLYLDHGPASAPPAVQADEARRVDAIRQQQSTAAPPAWLSMRSGAPGCYRRSTTSWWATR
ncbi:MAG TPA: alkaline phosphatase family protein [Solirubrobacteraceae bacterium]|nr:alkaline phosphatase family protein [Solirubrobacteraceae bacterium]